MFEKEDGSFGIQLVVIAILIPVYLQILPALIEPVWLLELTLPQSFSYFLGISWFVCLIFGTTSLAKGFSDHITIRFRKVYDKLFKWNCLITISIFILLISVYISVLNQFWLLPRIGKWGWLIWSILYGGLIFLVWLSAKKPNDKKVKKKW